MAVGVSGVIGPEGRYPLPPGSGPRARDLVLAGRPTPLAGSCRIYTCGITPYDVTHLGHAATFVWADLLTSLARRLDVATVTCRNVTDVDDVLTAAAGRGRRRYDELAVSQEFLFDRDMRDLGVARPDHTPHARAHVPQVIQLAEALLGLDRAYRVADTVFFRAPGDLDRRGLTEEQALGAFAEFGDRAEDGRRSPWDVPLWKPSTDDQPAWPSPWGWGRPAWHVECAAMATTVLGAVDVLVGGSDLAFPHHAYQAAIAEAALGRSPFARAQLQVGTVRYDGAKMAKSTGNLVLVRDLLSSASAPAIRMMLLHRSWAEPWDYAPRLLEEAAGRVDRLLAAADRAGSDDVATDRVVAALLDDLDVPTAVVVAEETGGAAARALLEVLRITG